MSDVYPYIITDGSINYLKEYQSLYGTTNRLVKEYVAKLPTLGPLYMDEESFTNSNSDDRFHIDTSSVYITNIKNGDSVDVTGIWDVDGYYFASSVNYTSGYVSSFQLVDGRGNIVTLGDYILSGGITFTDKYIQSLKNVILSDDLSSSHYSFGNNKLNTLMQGGQYAQHFTGYKPGSLAGAIMYMNDFNIDVDTAPGDALDTLFFTTEKAKLERLCNVLGLDYSGPENVGNILRTHS